MAEMKARHAFGQLENIDSALSANKIDSFDILFVKDSEGKPYVGWIDKNGQKEILDPYSGVAEAEARFEAEIAKKANAEDVETLEGQIAAKVDAETVQSMINEATVGVIEVVEF